jgi:hypothetical protein
MSNKSPHLNRPTGDSPTHHKSRSQLNEGNSGRPCRSLTQDKKKKKKRKHHLQVVKNDAETEHFAPSSAVSDNSPSCLRSVKEPQLPLALLPALPNPIPAESTLLPFCVSHMLWLTTIQEFFYESPITSLGPWTSRQRLLPPVILASAEILSHENHGFATAHTVASLVVKNYILILSDHLRIPPISFQHIPRNCSRAKVQG